MWNKENRVWEVPMENYNEALAIFPDAMIHPALQQAVEIIERRNRAALDIKNLNDINVKVDGLKGTLYNYQAVGKAFLDVLGDRQGAILAFDMGLGKSITSIAEFLDLYNKGIVKRCLIVCPASLKYSTWVKEIRKWTDLSYIVIDGEPSELEDRRALMDVAEEEWITDSNGKRVWTMEPVYKTTQLYFTRPITLEAVQGWRDAAGGVNFWKYCMPLLSQEDRESLNPEQDKPTTATVAYIANMPQELAMQIDTTAPDFDYGTQYVVGVVVDRFIKAKKTFQKRKTGKVVEKIVTLSGRALRDIQYQQDDCTFTIMNYELFLTDTSMMPPIDGSWAVICDEIQRAKNIRAQTTKILREKCKNAARKFALSGTPLENAIEELWSIVDFCRPGLLGTWSKFKDRYIQTDDYGNTIMPNLDNLPELKKKIAPIMIRRTKKECLPDLPPLIEQEYWVDMTETQLGIYEKMREGVLETMNQWGEKEFTYLNVLAQLTRLQQVLDSPAILREVLSDPELPEESGKLIELKNILDDLNVMEHKVILFSQYKEMTDILHSTMAEHYGLKAIRYIHGGVPSQLRGTYQDDFQTDPEVRIIILTTAGNYGLDLYEAEYVICYDQTFNPQKTAQVISRAHRNGAKNQVTALHLVTRDSYEERKLKLLERKKALFQSVIDNDNALFDKLFTKDDLKNLI
jgi:SNF2 family DNA or RNA helicase